MQVCVFWNPVVAPEWWCARSWPRPIRRATQHRCRCNSVASCCRPHKLWQSADGPNSVTMSKSVKRVVGKEAICITGASCTSIHCNFPTTTTRLSTWLCVCVQKSMDNFRGCRLNRILSCFVLRGVQFLPVYIELDAMCWISHCSAISCELERGLSLSGPNWSDPLFHGVQIHPKIWQKLHAIMRHHLKVCYFMIWA